MQNGLTLASTIRDAAASITAFNAAMPGGIYFYGQTEGEYRSIEEHRNALSVDQALVAHEATTQGDDWPWTHRFKVYIYRESLADMYAALAALVNGAPYGAGLDWPNYSFSNEVDPMFGTNMAFEQRADGIDVMVFSFDLQER